MSLKTSLLIVTMISVFIVLFHSFRYNQARFSCTSEYSVEIELGKKSIYSINNLSITMMNNVSAYVTINSLVKLSGITHHVSREVIYNLKVVDKKNGIYEIKNTETHYNYLDLYKDEKVAGFLFGMENHGRLIRIWKINQSIILIGNPFSPMMSCTRI